MNIYQKYGMSFIIFNGFLGPRPEPVLSDEATQFHLGGYLVDIKYPGKVDRVIAGVGKVLDGLIPHYLDDSDHTHYITVLPDVTHIYMIDYSAPLLPAGVEKDPDLTIPTVDFRDIMIEWKKFVEKPIEDNPGPLPV